MIDSRIKYVMKRAMIRRFGESMMPYLFQKVSHGSHCYRCIDVESGHMIEGRHYGCKGARLFIYLEQQGKP